MLSRNFSREEMIATSYGLPNEPDRGADEKIRYLANYILQRIRDRFGRIKVDSGYRSRAVNSKAGGSVSSQHLRGEAADIVPKEANIADVYRWIVEESGIPFGQCIWENGGLWIHISLVRDGVNNQALTTKDGKRYRLYNGKL